MSLKSPEKLKLEGSVNVANNLFANLQHIDGVKEEYSMMSPYKQNQYIKDREFNTNGNINYQSPAGQRMTKQPNTTGGKELFNVQIKNNIEIGRKQVTMPSSLVPIDTY